MAVGGEDDGKKKISRPKINLREVNMKYGRLVVFNRQDYAEIRGFQYRLTLGICTLKVMFSTGVFVRVICHLKRSISIDA